MPRGVIGNTLDSGSSISGSSPDEAAFLNTYFGDRYEAYSAGIEPLEINPNTAKVMKEIGIDISFCRPKRIEDLYQGAFINAPRT